MRASKGRGWVKLGPYSCLCTSHHLVKGDRSGLSEPYGRRPASTRANQGAGMSQNRRRPRTQGPSPHDNLLSDLPPPLRSILEAVPAHCAADAGDARRVGIYRILIQYKIHKNTVLYTIHEARTHYTLVFFTVLYTIHVCRV